MSFEWLTRNTSDWDKLPWTCRNSIPGTLCISCFGLAMFITACTMDCGIIGVRLPQVPQRRVGIPPLPPSWPSDHCCSHWKGAVKLLLLSSPVWGEHWLPACLSTTVSVHECLWQLLVSCVMVMVMLHSCELLGSIIPSTCLVWGYVATLATVFLVRHYDKPGISHYAVHKVTKCWATILIQLNCRAWEDTAWTAYL